MIDEGVLDARVTEWFEANPISATPFDDLSPEMLALARSPVGAPPTRAILRVTDDVVAGIPVRTYEHDSPSEGLIVYLHGGGFCIGSIGLMDNVARELAHCANAAVVSVEYRLAPEHPYPALASRSKSITSPPSQTRGTRRTFARAASSFFAQVLTMLTSAVSDL